MRVIRYASIGMINSRRKKKNARRKSTHHFYISIPIIFDHLDVVVLGILHPIVVEVVVEFLTFGGLFLGFRVALASEVRVKVVVQFSENTKV